MAVPAPITLLPARAMTSSSAVLAMARFRIDEVLSGGGGSTGSSSTGPISSFALVLDSRSTAIRRCSTALALARSSRWNSAGSGNDDLGWGKPCRRDPVRCGKRPSQWQGGPTTNLWEVTGQTLSTAAAGEDFITGSAGTDLSTGEARTTPSTAARLPTISQADSGDDVVFQGREGTDLLEGGGGNDILNGGGQVDNISGGDDNDTLAGGSWGRLTSTEEPATISSTGGRAGLHAGWIGR